MASERVQRRIERLLDQIEAEADQENWQRVWAHFRARSPDAGPAEIHGNGADVLIAARFERPLAATPVQGGYRIAGASTLCQQLQRFKLVAVRPIL